MLTCLFLNMNMKASCRFKLLLFTFFSFSSFLPYVVSNLMTFPNLDRFPSQNHKLLSESKVLVTFSNFA